MYLNFDEYKEKVKSCFIGKTVGGTLGMKFEGDCNINEVTYYDPVPDTMLPNDDLDLQVVNLETILRTGLPVCRYHIGEIWKHHIADSAPDEYGVAISNHALKINAPLSGIYRNKFYAGMGGAIRSELWACLAPANPYLAAMLAREDACTDHTEDGVYAEMFLAAVESAAFVESDLKKLINIGLEFIPEGNRLRNAFDDILIWWEELGDIKKVREKILEKYIVDNWTDVTINLSFIFLSLISCEGSFDKAICTAVSLGYDADCTGATVGSVFGIMNSNLIDKKWTEPIGNKLVLSPCIINMHEAGTIDDFCDKIISLAVDIQKYYKTDIEFENVNAEKINLAKPWLKNPDFVFNWENGAKESLVCLNPVMVTVCYPDFVALEPNKPTEYKLKITNITDSDIVINAEMNVPDNWTVELSHNSFAIASGETLLVPFRITAQNVKRRTLLNILTVKLSVNGLKFDVEAGIPLTAPWTVTNLDDGTERICETNNIYFPVPKGSYKYTTKIKSPSTRKVRISAGGTSKFKLIINGEEIFSGDASFYVPTFHRDESWTYANLNVGENEIEVIFDNDLDGEFFFGFSTVYSCAIWLDSIERYL